MNAKIISLFLSLLLLATVVFAAGSSGRSGGSTATKTVVNTVAPPNCDDKEILRDRVRCRLINKVQGNGAHESCIAANDRNACQNLYDRSTPCYTKRGVEKDQCFRKL